LQSLPAQQDQLAIGLIEMGQFAGRKLPPTAFHDRCWWANTASSPQGAAWTSTGWSVDRLYLEATGDPVVVFRRKGWDTLRRIPKYVWSLLVGARFRSRPDSATVIRWLRFCRAVGWYFEGSVLYEKAGPTFDSLTEVERAELDEDYAICKRELARYRFRGDQR